MKHKIIPLIICIFLVVSSCDQTINKIDSNTSNENSHDSSQVSSKTHLSEVNISSSEISSSKSSSSEHSRLFSNLSEIPEKVDMKYLQEYQAVFGDIHSGRWQLYDDSEIYDMIKIFPDLVEKYLRTSQGIEYMREGKIPLNDVRIRKAEGNPDVVLVNVHEYANRFTGLNQNALGVSLFWQDEDESVNIQRIFTGDGIETFYIDSINNDTDHIVIGGSFPYSKTNIEACVFFMEKIENQYKFIDLTLENSNVEEWNLTIEQGYLLKIVRTDEDRIEYSHIENGIRLTQLYSDDYIDIYNQNGNISIQK